MVVVAEVVGLEDDGRVDLRKQIWLVELEHLLQGRLEKVEGATLGIGLRDLSSCGRCGLERNVPGVDKTILAGEDGTMNNIVELTDVARPVVVEQRLNSIRCERDLTIATTLTVDAKEVLRQGKNIAGSVPQGRYGKSRHVQAKEEILPKPSGAYGCPEIDVRRRNKADIDGGWRTRAETHHLALLQNAQQLHLKEKRNVADFVEKERAAVGGLEPAGFRRSRARECASLVAKELGIGEFRGKCAAVHGHERGGMATAQLVNVPCHNLLSCAGLTRD